MKKLSTFCIIAFSMLLLVSCTERKMSKFSEEFATAVTNNDTAAIAKMYPDSKIAEKLSIDFVKDSLSVEERADTFVVNIGSDKSLSIVKSEDGELRIVDSHGLFSYPQNRMDFALKTGWVKQGMSDLTIAEQFADTTFINYLVQKTVGQIKSQLIVKGIGYNFSNSGPHGTMVVIATVTNKSEYEISGSDYEVTVKWYDQNKTHNGEDIKPGESKTFTLSTEPAEGNGSASIRFTCSDAELLTKYFIPKGVEYDDFQRSL